LKIEERVEFSNPYLGEKYSVFGEESKVHSVSKKCSSGYCQERCFLKWSLVSIFLQGKSKLVTGNRVPSSQTATKITDEWRASRRND
jgi:hypothetical protein